MRTPENLTTKPNATFQRSFATPAELCVGPIYFRPLMPIQKTICEQLNESSEYIKQWLVSQPSVKEESLTDWLLYHVSLNVPSVLYHAFTRHEEARKTGADWEWWLLFKEQSMRLRVQAKKVLPTGDNYPGLAHTNRYGLQIDMLRADAKKANALAIYALYYSQSLQTLCGNRPSQTDSVYLAGANRLNTDFIIGVRQSITAADLLLRSVPLPCIACCPHASDPSDRLSRFFETYFASELEEPEGRNIQRGIHSQLPAYVSSLLEHRGESIPDWWEKDFQSSIQEFNAILIYDYRNV